jgi:threonine dehydratase
MLNKVEEAYNRIKDGINQTPVMKSSTINEMLNCNCYFKLENFQKTGSFKIRGALNALNSLPSELKAKGVTTHSSGNFAQALSLASSLAKVKAVVVMPENAPKIKIVATKGYGAEVVFCGSKPGDREEVVQELIDKQGYTLIHPSNDIDVIYGQGTATYELIKEVGNLDFVFAPCGGGGLLSGTAIAAKSLNSETKVIGVEPKNADDAYRSFREGKIYPSINPNTIADGLKTQLGDITFKVVQEHVDDIITVTEEEIVNAMEFLWTRMKLVVEPSGAVSLAGVISGKIDVSSKKVGIIISGGNTDLTNYFTEWRKRIE